jgi:hypothetical protein
MVVIRQERRREEVKRGVVTNMTHKRSSSTTSNTRFDVKNQYSINSVHLQPIVKGQICQIRKQQIT